MKQDIREVARRAGVSIGTVSNVLNHPDRVSDATRQRVQAVMDEVGYVRNESARHLREGRSRTVGMVVLDVANPFFTDVVTGVEEVADAHGSVVTVANSADRLGRQRRHLEVFLEQRVQGLLITPTNDAADDGLMELLDRFTERGIPVVLVDRRAESGFCSVAVDDVAGGRLAGEHLAGLGRERIAYLGGPPELPQVRDRLAGARSALAPHGLAMHVTRTRSLTLVHGYRAAAAILERHADIDAIFAANDLLALGALRRILETRRSVPDDVAVVGYDDILFARAAAIPLTSVRQPRAALGRTAAEQLFEEVRQGPDHEHRTVEFTPDLVVRASTGG